MKPSLALLVLYVEDLEASRIFYTALGLDLVREQHERGPMHYSVVLAEGGVIELYPRGLGEPTRVRLGLRVLDVATAVEAVRQLDAEVRKHDTSSAVVVDPDGNAVELNIV